MMTIQKIVLTVVLAAGLAGCIPTQTADTPISAVKQTEPKTGETYWLYVPSYYKADRQWPLVVTLHGTHGWDSSSWQMREWQEVAERYGLIVVAPQMQSVQGILPVTKVLKDTWMNDLHRDEEVILATIDDISGRYKVDPKAVLLTAFSAGGYPLYYTGLRHPERFNMLIARACNSSNEIFDRVEVTDQVRQLPVMIFWGRDDLSAIQEQSWAAYRWLRDHHCAKTERRKIKGGHLRHPDLAYEIWRDHLPEQYRVK